MKRIILLCTLLLAVTALYAEKLPLSIGAGLRAEGLFTRYQIDANGVIDGTQIFMHASQRENNFGGGAFAFLDAKYLTAMLGWHISKYNFTQDQALSAGSPGETSWQGLRHSVDISIWGKYPFQLNKSWTVFPLMGLEFQFVYYDAAKLSGSDYWYHRPDVDNNTSKGEKFTAFDYSSFWIHLGGGAEYNLPRNFFLRADLSVGFRLPTFYEADGLKSAKDQVNDSHPRLHGITIAPQLKLSAGYRLGNKTKSISREARKQRDKTKKVTQKTEPTKTNQTIQNEQNLTNEDVKDVTLDEALRNSVNSVVHLQLLTEKIWQ
jgi:hypothetical protein